jgi:hypothetical protein
MLIETWVAALFAVLIFVIGLIGILGLMIADQRLEECRKENSALREKNRILQGKLIVKTATEFYKEGKKK